MNIPLNGRIAIIDDKIEQAIPLMRVLSKNQIPYVYYKGNDLKFLPEEDSRYNDIRILFLDINLLNDLAKQDDKVLKSVLYSVLKRVISPNNFPYTLIYWSRHQDEYSSIVEELFNNELKDRKPINLKEFIKSDFFPNFSADEVENEIDLLMEINKIIDSQLAYSYLLNWENQVHLAADLTLQEIFSSYHMFKDWTNNANFILEKLGKAYLGNHYITNTLEDKIRASFIAFNSVFKDSLESQIYNSKIPNSLPLTYNKSEIEFNINLINEKLNLSKEIKDICESGNVIVFENRNDLFATLLHRLISLFKLKNKFKVTNKDIEEIELTKIAAAEHKRIKTEIKASWKKIAIVVTPVCDFVQKDNKIYDRIVKGVMIPLKYKDYIDDKSEAVYILPISITHNGSVFIIVLDFRYFVTLDFKVERISGLFRVRQELLSEIQSKLARHINRQGVLFIDER